MRSARHRMRTLLKVKTHQEQKAQTELAQIREAKQREEEVLSDLEQERAQAFTGTDGTTRCSARDLQANSSYITNISNAIRRHETKVEAMSREEEAKREELVARSQSRKMVEKLNEKKTAEETKDQEQREQKTLDMFGQRSSREDGA